MYYQAVEDMLTHMIKASEVGSERTYSEFKGISSQSTQTKELLHGMNLAETSHLFLKVWGRSGVGL